MRIKLVVTYDGTGFCGWQRQKNGVSVQETLENAIFSLTGERVSVVGSGRTDAGVHAEGQVAHFDTSSTVPAEKFYLALNAILPESVKIRSSERVSDDFNARFSAKKKTYEYNFYISETVLPLKDRFAVMTDGKFDFDVMRKCAEEFIGTHDFNAFSSTGSKVKTTERTIYSLTFSLFDGGFSIAVTGNGFLYNMVRVIVGALCSVGKGERTIADVKAALTSGKRDRLFKTMPAKGLTLKSVEYSD